MTAGLSHEIRNPLNAIGLNAELLEEELAGGGGSDEARALVSAIGHEVDRLGAVTEEYLRFARLPRPAFGREDLNELLSALCGFLAPELERAGIALDLVLAPGLPPVRGDEAQLRAAFLNLLRNSREAMARGGALAVATRRGPAGEIEAEVRDTGAGIPPEALPRIFEPFYSTKEKGTGLGLAYAQQVIQEHGGTIRCASAPGEGTIFTVRLPAAPDERAVEAVDREAVGA
jgi:signal transduction histidine kinase